MSADIRALGETERLLYRTTNAYCSVWMPGLIQPTREGMRRGPHTFARGTSVVDTDVLDLAHDAILIRGSDGGIGYWNRAAEDLYGWTSEEAVGRVSHELLQTVFPVPIEQIENDLVRSGRWEGVLVHTRRNGTKISVASRWSLRRGTASVPFTVVVYEVHVSRPQLAEAAAEAPRGHELRMIASDAGTAAVAHEVRQPLTAMVTSADAGFRFLDREVPNLERAKAAFKQIVADGHRAAAVVESIRSNLRNDERSKTRLDLNALIEEALVLQRNDLQKHRILVQLEASERLPGVTGNRVQLRQVLLNLIANAIDAMAMTDDPRVLVVRSQAHEDGGVMVSLIDNGMGIDSRDCDRIFRPLFTTKADGMGMGLSICRAIVEAHHGRLWAAPNVPCGAAFRFTLRSGRAPDADA